MSYQRSADYRAVFIFADKKLVRQLLWLEFEAVLDGFVPLVEQASQKVQAVYLTLAAGPTVKAAVFFLIDFDEQGFADQRWNIPVEQLAENSAPGPDLGGGPIRLACRSQCSISWHQQQLWDPDMEPDSGHFASIRKAVEVNRLHFPAREENTAKPDLAPSGGLPAASTASTELVELLEAERQRSTQQSSEHQLHIATLQEKHQQQLADLKAQHGHQVQEMASQLASERQTVTAQQLKIAEQEERIAGLQQKIGGLREYFEHKLESRKTMDKAALLALAQQQDLEKAEAVQAETAALREQLQIRDIEVMYRDTQLQNLQTQIDKLQREKQALLQNSGNQLLGRLQECGVSFITFQPGAGQMTLSLDQLSQFMQDKSDLVAQKCGVNRQTYLAWLQHYRQPDCAAPLANGQRCSQPVARVNDPADFIAGNSDRCDSHRSDSDQPVTRQAAAQ
ncbi:hypothetical protein G8764_00005 [Pseudomaricurvus alcaniphilus]|uniref:hypothetical protein n=1 Tax=Pseudomaricurvus alcaniphilus TaxID=1166482 RepID=UPI00140AA2E3|nr:hypothetical protein [Pseudomaricurvus alcaniphilus]NHN35671.1 hypothetical protein [Pseudomaricurvus alcaniphilus]